MRDEIKVAPTPERVAKGGVRNIYDPDGRYCRTEVLPDTILGWLIHRDLIDPYYGDVASAFAGMRQAFLHQTAYKAPKFFQSDNAGTGDDLAASRYLKACRILGPATTRFLLDAIEPGWDVCPAVAPNDYLWAVRALDKAVAGANKEV